MAEDQDASKGKQQEVEQNSAEAAPQASKPGVSSQEGEISDEDLDAAIAASDPNFAKSLNDIGPELSKSDVEIETLDLDSLAVEKVSLKERFKKIAIRLKHASEKSLNRFVDFVHDSAIYMAKDGRKIALAWLISSSKTLLAFILAPVNSFLGLSLKKKLFFFASIIFFSGSVAGIYYLRKANYFQQSIRPFIGSFEEVAVRTLTWDPAKEGEYFYGSIRNTIHSYMMDRMVINVKVGAGSKSNPMLATELLLESMSRETLIEVKARNAETRDKVQRVIEDFDFATLDTEKGKELLKEAIKKELNSILLQGEISTVRFRTFILKP